MADSIDEILDSSDVIVVGNRPPEFQGLLPKLRDKQILIDLVRIAGDTLTSTDQYQGICW